MSDWQQYRRTNIAEMRPFVPGEDLSEISVSATDDPETDHGMIARNPDNHQDQWYVARAYFEKNFEVIAQRGEYGDVFAALAVLVNQAHEYSEDHEKALIEEAHATVRRHLTASAVPYVPEQIRRLPEKWRKVAANTRVMSLLEPADEAAADIYDQCAQELERALASAPAEFDGWQPIETAPKDGTEILGWCVHDADPYCLEGGKRLTDYGANAEGMSHVDDGVNKIKWHDAIDEGEYVIPAWWCLADSWGETAANPTHWMPLPAAPHGGE